MQPGALARLHPARHAPSPTAFQVLLNAYWTAFDVADNAFGSGVSVAVRAACIALSVAVTVVLARRHGGRQVTGRRWWRGGQGVHARAIGRLRT